MAHMRKECWRVSGLRVSGLDWNQAMNLATDQSSVYIFCAIVYFACYTNTTLHEKPDVGRHVLAQAVNYLGTNTDSILC